ncbi:MAG: acyltransferase [Bacteroidetes bacterium]|nr:MAG: acyltransferase [Bacteroidota bacterium]MBL1145393.1 acyltransferase [Bacteroidota bacterium]NOG58191.1 acyltransferase [Bacteroidota bacterium]
MNNKPVYLKGLNGIRAIAAIAVVFSHSTLRLDLFGLNAHILGTQINGEPRSFDLAGYGVSMFFTLSGFLITYLLLLEKEKRPISIRKFYYRRILRIWPLYYAYMLICFLCYFFFNINTNYSSTYYYLFYAANIPFILGKELFLLGHFWSLAVEEQFYLFWPWLNRLNVKLLKKIILVLIFLLVGLKLIFHFIFQSTLVEVAIHVTRFHCMLIGCYASILYYEKNRIFLKIATHKAIQLLAWVAISLVAVNMFHIASIIDNEIITFITVIIILGQITSKGLINLENKLFNFLGKISYGIYVIHPIIIFLCSKILIVKTGFVAFDYIVVYSVIIGLTILFSYLSFTYFETFFLQIKKKKYTVIYSTSDVHETKS